MKPERILVCLLLLLLPVLSQHGLAQEPLPETDVKAAFLYNFTKFVQWPAETFPSDESPIMVGVFGDEDFVSTVRKLLADKKAHGHAFQVRRLVQNADAKVCHVLFFRDAEAKRFAAIADSIKRLAILTVGESSDFLDTGGMFNLFFEEKQLRFEVNPAAAESAHLTISSKLLRLAKNVRKGGGK